MRIAQATIHPFWANSCCLFGHASLMLTSELQMQAFDKIHVCDTPSNKILIPYGSSSLMLRMIIMTLMHICQQQLLKSFTI